MKLVEYDKNNLTETRVEYQLYESGARGGRGKEGQPGTTVHNDTTGKDGIGTFHISSDQADSLTNARTALDGANPVASAADTFLNEGTTVKVYAVADSVPINVVNGRVSEVNDTSADPVVHVSFGYPAGWELLDSFAIVVAGNYPPEKKVKVEVTTGRFIYLSKSEGVILRVKLGLGSFELLGVIRSGDIKNVDLVGAQLLLGQMTGDFSTLDTSPFTIDTSSLIQFSQDGQWAGFKNISGGAITIIGTFDGAGTTLPDKATMVVSRRIAKAYNFDIVGGLV